MAKLNEDAFSFLVLQEEYRHQMEDHARLSQHENCLREKLERCTADRKTAGERATSIMETLLKLNPPLPIK